MVAHFCRATPGHFWIAPNHLTLGWIHTKKKDFEKALPALEKAHALFESPMSTASLAYGYAAAGRKEQALKILERLKQLARERYVQPFPVAEVYAALGDKDSAFQWLEKAF